MALNPFEPVDPVGGGSRTYHWKTMKRRQSHPRTTPDQIGALEAAEAIR